MREQRRIERTPFKARFEIEGNSRDLWMIDHRGDEPFPYFNDTFHVKIKNIRGESLVIPWGTMVNIVR
jgi:hypothetical protein